MSALRFARIAAIAVLSRETYRAQTATTWPNLPGSRLTDPGRNGRRLSSPGL